MKRKGVIIDGVKQENSEVFFLMKFTDVDKNEVISAKDAKKYWPLTVINYFERHLEWVPRGNNAEAGDVPTTELTNDNVNFNDYPDDILCK